MFTQNESNDLALDPVLAEGFENDVNLLPPEILARILTHLPQHELVRNRCVSSYWRDTIDEHCTMKVVIRADDKFLDRKLQLRINECKILGLPENSTNISFAYPQSVKSIIFWCDLNIKPLRQLFIQVKPYIHYLEIKAKDFQENILTPPFIFPSLREIKIIQYHDPMAITPFNFNMLFCHRMPFLKTMYLFSRQLNLEHVNEMHSRFFNFLSVHVQSIKRLDLDIQFVTEYMGEPLPGLSQIFEIPNQVKNRLNNGQLQLERLSLALPERLVPVWAPIIKRQKNLIDFSVETVYFQRWTGPGIPFHMILSTIQPNFATLSKLRINDISSVSLDGTTWVPLDCTAFREMVNLSELSLLRVTFPKLNVNDGAPIINLGEIPLANLKKFYIILFVCDSEELQTLVDNAPLLEVLHLASTQAPSGSPRYACTGPKGGVIQSFVEKTNKIRIHVHHINVSNEEETKKLDALRLLFPNSLEIIRQNFQYFSHDFTVRDN